MNENKDQLYPTLPAASAPPENHPGDYRLIKISEIQQELKSKRDKRRALYKKYHAGVNTLDGVDTVLITGAMGTSAVGVGLLATVVATPVAIRLQIGALICGLLGVICKYTRRRLEVKANKHSKLSVLYESKINTITSHISKALRDGHITDVEFDLVLTELQKCENMKEEIRSSYRKKYSNISNTALFEEEKKALFIKKKEDILKQLEIEELKLQTNL